MAFNQDFIPAPHRFRCKTLDDVVDGGCHINVYPAHADSSAKSPVVMMIHGGGYSLGTAEWLPFNQVRYLLANGVTVLSIEHRLLPHVGIKEIREDCLDAYRYVQTQINHDLSHAGATIQVDGSRAAAIGWSSGGSLCIFLATDVLADPTLPPLKAVQLGYPLADFSSAVATKADFEQAIAAPELRQVYDAVKAEKCATAWSHVPPGPATEPPAPPPAGVPLPPRLAYFFLNIPGQLYVSQVLQAYPPFPPDSSPHESVTSGFPPTFILAAGADVALPMSQSPNLAAQLKGLGVECQLVEAKNMAHGQLECLSFFPPWEKELGEEWWREAVTPALDFVVKKISI